jgi:hypothetical protein
MTQPTPWRGRLLKAAIFAIFLAGIGGYFLYGGPYLNSANLAAQRDLLLDYTHQHYWPMLLATATIYLAATALSVAATALGIAPASFVMTSLGQFLAGAHPIADLEYFEDMLLHSPITIAAVICGLLALISVRFTRRRARNAASRRSLR